MILIIPEINHFGINGITLFPFIILRDKKLKTDKQIMNHERIHIRQQIEMLIIPFYVVYITEYVIGLLKFRNKANAYLNISFEKEAYANDKDLNYLKSRKLWAWITFL